VNSAPSSPTSATLVSSPVVSSPNVIGPRVSSPHVSKGSVDQAGAETSKRALTGSEPPASAGGLNSGLIQACTAAVGELSASRELISALDAENAALKERLDTEKRATQLLGELNETRKSETEALRAAIAAKNEALTAKDAVIASQDKLIGTLKQKKSSPWKRLGDVLIGVGVGVLLR